MESAVSSDCLFQSTFPRGERRYFLISISFFRFISIHVPAWGTTELGSKHARFDLFQSTFPRGERHDIVVLDVVLNNEFQSTFPRGERQSESATRSFSNSNFNPRSRVGNDQVRYMRIPDHYHFNPRSRVGNDSNVPIMLSPRKLFQSTFPRGERPEYRVSAASFFHFNPRSRVGNDCKFQQFFTYIFV